MINKAMFEINFCCDRTTVVTAMGVAISAYLCWEKCNLFSFCLFCDC